MVIHQLVLFHFIQSFEEGRCGTRNSFLCLFYTIYSYNYLYRYPLDFHMALGGDKISDRSRKD